MNKVHLLLALMFFSFSMGKATTNVFTCTKHRTKNPFFCKNKDGSLDIRFGSGGKVITDMGGNDDNANAIVTLPCGKLVAVGTSNAAGQENDDFALAGYDAHGFLDNCFGTNGNGKVLTDFGTLLAPVQVLAEPPIPVPSIDQANDAILQKNCNGCDMSCCVTECKNQCTSNCKIVAVGTSSALPGSDNEILGFAIARYNCNGTLDTSFGTHNTGVEVISIGGIADIAFAVALQADNKIVVVGTTANNTTKISNFVVVRLNCNGTLDTTFGCDGTGIVIITFDTNISRANAVAIQNDGKIVVGGSVRNIIKTHFALVRLNSNGILDKCFGDQGKVITDFSGNNTSTDSISALVLPEHCVADCDGLCGVKIIAVGNSDVNGSSDFALAGYRDTGCLESCFGPSGTGLVTTDFSNHNSDLGNAAILQKDCNKGCKIVVAGSTFNAESGSQNNFALARYKLNGCLDSEFGMRGTVVTSFPPFGGVANAVTIAENGDIVLAGSALSTKLMRDFALTRYNICQSCFCKPGCAVIDNTCACCV